MEERLDSIIGLKRPGLSDHWCKVCGWICPTCKAVTPRDDRDHDCIEPDQFNKEK